MRTPYYREQALEGIAREVITAYDPNLYYGVPRMIPIEDIIEAQGITLEYQCLRKTGCVLGETIFDDGGAITASCRNISKGKYMSLFISALGPSLETFLKFKNSIGIQYNASAQWCLKSFL